MLKRKKKTKLIEVLSDQDLWSLLNGYGPGHQSRSPRDMLLDDRMLYLYEQVKRITANAKAHQNLRLVIEVME